jgi:predicted regulator of Ras-like GTPase activity (Roadblock/LC7/MglB family)
MSNHGRSTQLDEVLSALLRQSPELEAAAIVSFDGLPMASALPPEMDESRVAAMSAALLSLGERAAEGLGRGDLSQVYIEGADGTVFLVSAEGEAVLVAVAAASAKAGLVLYELRRAAKVLGEVLRSVEAQDLAPAVAPAAPAPATAVEMPALEPVAKQAHPLDTSVAMPAVDPAAVPAQESAPATGYVPGPAVPAAANGGGSVPNPDLLPSWPGEGGSAPAWS